MTLKQKIESWLTRWLWHKNDTSETIEQKVFLVWNMIIPAIIISLSLILMLILKLFKLFLLNNPLIWYMIITVVLLKVIKRGIKWLFYLYYGGYIVMCCILILIVGGLPNSGGVWGGSTICFLLVLGLKNKRFLVINACIYTGCLLILGFSYPYLTPFNQMTPEINNLFFTTNEIWICLYLVKVFYDSIVIKTNEAKNKAKQLLELDLLKSKLYANIAHEFRTPLTLIRGNAEEIGGIHGGETFERANCIKQNSDKILFLVNQMLNLSRIEEGGVPMHYIQGDLVVFVRFIVSSFQGYAESRKIGLHFKPSCPQLMMDIESGKLEECLSNLLSNAIKYTPAGGDVFVTIRIPQTTEPQVEINVRDTGIGIPEDQLDKIFIRFYRVEDNRYPYQEGSGIGLTIVCEYLKLMKGSISVRSRPGMGSEFVIVLPVTHDAEIGDVVPVVKGTCTSEKKHGASETAKINIGTNHPRLLIIEDNKELIGYLGRLLGGEYHLLTADNGIQGTEVAIEHIPDIILSDVMIPGKDGYQVCKELKNDFRTNHIPIVLLTGRADTASRITGMEHGADAYIAKPFYKKELIICLHNLLVQREILRLKFRDNLFESKPEEKAVGLNEKFLVRVIQHLEKNYENDRYGLNNLCSDIGISRVQLYRKLIAITGQSASNFIRSFRLQKARKLLLETSKNVSDIAYEVGFADANYFSKAFFHEYGLTATELRKSFA